MKSQNITLKTKIKILKSNILGILLYSAESQKVTKTICHKLDVFQSKCLRRILGIFWPQTISNEELYRRTGTAPLSQEIRKRRWLWIGHIHRMGRDTIPRVALRWSPPGKRTRGRPKETWRRSVEREIKDQGWNWGQITLWAQDRQHWQALVKALCATLHEED